MAKIIFFFERKNFFKQKISLLLIQITRFWVRECLPSSKIPKFLQNPLSEISQITHVFHRGGDDLAMPLTIPGQEQAQQDEDVPEMQVFDQAKFIKQRQAKISQIKHDAKGLNTLASEINGKIHEQDEKLDKINSELEYNVQNLKDANQDLEEAVKLSGGGGRNKCFIPCLIGLSVTVVGGGVALFFI